MRADRVAARPAACHSAIEQAPGIDPAGEACPGIGQCAPRMRSRPCGGVEPARLQRQTADHHPARSLSRHRIRVIKERSPRSRRAVTPLAGPMDRSPRAPQQSGARSCRLRATGCDRCAGPAGALCCSQSIASVARICQWPVPAGGVRSCPKIRRAGTACPTALVLFLLLGCTTSTMTSWSVYVPVQF